MISYFPAIYPDELVYSWFCRYYVHSGFFSSKSAMQELYCKRSDNPSKEFIGNLNPGAVEQIATMFPLDKLVLEHTMYPQYARFIPLEQKNPANQVINGRPKKMPRYSARCGRHRSREAGRRPIFCLLPCPACPAPPGQ